MTSKITGIDIHDFNCGLKIYRKAVAKDLKIYGELHRFLPVLAHWNGFRVGEIPVQHHARKFGKTKFGISRFFNGFFDLLTVLFITRYQTSPLHIFGLLGVMSALIGSAIEIYLSILWFMGEGIRNRPLFFLGILAIIVPSALISIKSLNSERPKKAHNLLTRISYRAATCIAIPSIFVS